MKSSAVMVGVSVALSLRAAMAGQDLPQHLKDLAVVWLDANINLIQDAEGGVREWRDVREAEVERVMRESLTRFNHEACAQKYIDLYEKMLNRPLVKRFA